ncbi:MAG: permease [Alphaproteobacteria bacterium]|nr:permease [Alphaproteobacteria bacterium]
MSQCCHQPPSLETSPESECAPPKRRDLILWGSLSLIAMAFVLYALGVPIPHLHVFVHGVLDLVGTMWWGVALGVIIVGLMNKVPREYFQLLLGRGDSFGGLMRAAFAGVLLDLCSHGILMVGAKLYERGASVAQVMTFLIASPWNSFSLTLILIALIGLQWTLVFIAGSFVVAVVSGLVFQQLTQRGILPENPLVPYTPPDFDWRADLRARWREFHFTPRFIRDVLVGGLPEARMLIRWLLLGIIIAAATRAFIPPEFFAAMFGPTLIGLFITLAAATVIEVCSEGSAPIAAEILNRAAAPGNAFTFLMAGVATDYTEILVLRDATKSWKVALALPLVTVPQIILLALLMNG